MHNIVVYANVGNTSGQPCNVDFRLDIRFDVRNRINWNYVRLLSYYVDRPCNMLGWFLNFIEKQVRIV